MTRIVILILAISVLFLSCLEEHGTPENKLRKSISDFSDKTSMSYDLSYRLKYFDYLDTTNISAKTIFIKEKSDSLFGGYIWFSRKDSVMDYIKYYNLNSFYSIDNIKREVLQHSNPVKPIPYGFTNNFDGKLIKTYFFQTNDLNNFFQDSTYKTKVSEEDGSLKLSVFYPDEEQLVNQTKEIFFNHSGSSIKKIIFKAELDSLEEYNEWNLNNLKFDAYKPKDLEQKFRSITKDYQFKEYQPPSIESLKKEYAPLKNGQIAEDFKGDFLIETNSEFNLSNFSDEIIILDFWYRTCPPCIKSVPQLNNIYSKYKSKGVKLFGINNIDIDSFSRAQLIPFLQKEEIEYPIVLTDRSVSEKYNVKVYPTLYIINKEGEVEYSKLGYTENLEGEVDHILNKIMK